MSDNALAPIALPSIEAARARIPATALRTPLIPLVSADLPPKTDIYLKLENLQAIGSFKIRGASNAMAGLSGAALREGVTTASMGNMAQGVAWNARRLGIPCRVFVPENAPATKLAAIEALGAEIQRIPFADWWRIIESGHCPGALGRFIHPVADEAVIAGHGVIGLELCEALPKLDAVLIPMGGGGLTLGIASAIQQLQPQARVYAVEPETANPLTRSWRNGERVPAPYQASFVDGCGGVSVLPRMWPALRQVLDGALSVSLPETAAAIRALATKARVVAEGAGAVSVAAALSGRAGAGRIACIVSGGNINETTLAEILSGRIPGGDSGND